MVKPWNIGILTVTEEQVETALNNGLKRHNIQTRIDMGWSIEKAITQPVLKKRRLRYTEQDEIEAQLNGILIGTFRSRVNNFKWSVERAKTEPINHISQRSLTLMEWNETIRGLKQQLNETEQWIKNNNVPQSLKKAIDYAIVKQQKEITRLEYYVQSDEFK